MSSGVSFPSTSSSESPDHSSNSLKEDQIEEKGQGGNEESSDKTTTLRYGSVSLMGRRREMEDAIMVAPEMVAGKYAFFAAYDGRGGDGVANACRKRMRELLENELEANVEKPPGEEQTTSSCGSGKIDWKKEMAECFSRADDEVLDNMWDTDAWVAEEAVGSRTAVVMAGKEEVVVATNCGDSRAVLCRGGVVIPLSNCHQPERSDEKERVEAARDWKGCHMLGVLSNSRSIGDDYLKPYVISEPEVTVIQRTESDEFLIIATHGLWDVVSHELACEIVRKRLESRIRGMSSSQQGAAEAAVILAKLAIGKGSTDNISVIVVELKTKL